MGHFCCRFWSCCGDSWPFRPRTGGPCSCTLTGRTGLRPRLSLSRCTHTRALHPCVPCTCHLRHCVGAEVPRAVGRGNCHLGECFGFQRGYFPPPCEGLDTFPAPEAVLSSEPCPPSLVCHHQGAGRGEPPRGPACPVSSLLVYRL